MKSPDEVLHDAEELRWQLPQNLHDRIAESIYGEAARLAERNITRSGESRRMAWQQKLDRLLTNPCTSFPIMILVLGLIQWVTIVGANVPSAILSKLLVNDGHALLSGWLMLFSLCHNPCSTTLYTIYRETRSWKWTTVSALLPLVIGFALCAIVAAVWRALV